MAGGNKVGDAYVEVTPKASGDFTRMLDGEVAKAGRSGGLFGKTFSSGMTGAISAGAVAVGNILADVIESGASMAKSLASSAFGGYKEYEQLVGGMDTLFKESSNQMQVYAYDAFATAQMSANDYMSLATDLSASMVSSVGGDTALAAELTNTAVMDMADNANKMGTSMADIENAYKGFSKQNYTMLDNLSFAGGMAA